MTGTRCRRASSNSLIAVRAHCWLITMTTRLTAAREACAREKAEAQPVAAVYEQGRVRYVGAFSKLEDQMTTYTSEGSKSPDRLDALVWAITDLILSKSVPKPGIRKLN